MLNRYESAIIKAKNGEYREAYQAFSDLIKENKEDYLAICYRGLVDFMHLNEETDQTIEDFETLIHLHTPYANQVLPYLVLLYSHIGNYQKAIEYGEEALKVSEELALDLHFALSKSYYGKGDYASLLVSLRHIESCIQEEPEEIQDFHICKIDILIALSEFEKANRALEELYSKFGSSFIYYYLQAKALLELFKQKSENKTDLEEAMRNIDTALQYEEHNLPSILLKVEILTYLHQKDKALELLETVKKEFEEDEYEVEKFKIYEEMNEDNVILEECEKYLQHHDSWRIYYSYAFFLAKRATTIQEVLRVKELYEKAYERNKEIFIFNEIYRLNYVLNKDEENLLLVEEWIQRNPSGGRFHYLLGETKQRLDFPFEEIITEYTIAKEKGYLDQLRYLTIIGPLIERPKSIYKALKSYQKIDTATLSPWMQRRMGIRYLYGEEGYPIQIEKAGKILEHASSLEKDEFCMLSTYGRYLELHQEFEKAFEVYQEAYELQQNEFLPTCNCAVGYLAHAYLNGIGTKKDIEKAKNLILFAVAGLKERSSNIVIYLYSYFALQGDSRFDLQKSYQYLNQTYPFQRYEITRVMMLKLVARKLGKNLSQIDEQIYQCLKFGDKQNKKYYKENKNKEIIYPAFNNY